MNRRSLLSTAGAVSGTILAGCTSILTRGTVSLYLVNWRKTEQEVTVKIETSRGELVHEEKYVIPSNADVKDNNVVEGGRYKITAIDERGREQQFAFQMGDCTDQKVTIRLNVDGAITIERNHC